MTLTLISCNIRFDNPRDADNSWDYRKKNLADTLLEHSPHIIATQEGRYSQLKDFETLLPDYEILDSHRSWIKDRMYPSFFVKKNNFEYLNSGDVWLSETPEVAGSRSFDSAFPRLMTWSKLQLKNSETKILFINTHLDHIKESTRLKQTEVLSQEILKLLSDSSKLIIMGDFNDSPSSKVRQVLNENFDNLVDTWKMFNQIEETSHHAFSGECQNGSRIDWILTDKSIETVNCILDKKNFNGKYPTDHFPVVCKIKA